MPVATELSPLTDHAPFTDMPRTHFEALPLPEPYLVPTPSAPVGSLTPGPWRPEFDSRPPQGRHARHPVTPAIGIASVRSPIPVIPGTRGSAPRRLQELAPRHTGSAPVNAAARVKSDEGHDDGFDTIYKRPAGRRAPDGTPLHRRSFSQPTDEETTHLLGVWQAAGRTTPVLGRSSVKMWDHGEDVSAASTLRLEAGEAHAIVRHRKENRTWEAIKHAALALGGLVLGASDAAGATALLHNHDPASFWSAIF